MSMQFKSSRRIGCTLLLGLALAGLASATAAVSPDVLKRIESARTRADHEALATYFDRESASARAMATDHKQMAGSYLKYQSLAAAKWPEYTMPAHCDAIVRNQQAIAAEYEGIAAQHRQMAARAQP